MSDCIRCHQPILPGQFYLRPEYDPVDLADLLRQPTLPPDQRSFTARGPYRMHVDCPKPAAAEGDSGD